MSAVYRLFDIPSIPIIKRRQGMPLPRLTNVEEHISQALVSVYRRNENQTRFFLIFGSDLTASIGVPFA